MSLTKVSYSMISGAPVNITDFGAVGDSNGTPGNGTDNTAAIQAAVTYANANGFSVYLPTGTYRITAPINFTGIQAKSDFIGESNFNTVIFADFISATPVAALSVANTTSPRAYVGFKNFQLLGKSTANVSGIYSNFGSEFTEFQNVWVRNFYNGFVLATNYHLKLTNCQAWTCTNNGFQVGYTLDGILSPANNVAFIGCLATDNAANGFYIASCRALGMVQCDSESNVNANIYLDTVYGASLTGIYMEYGPTVPGNPPAQLYIKNSTGIAVNGLSVSAFDNSSNPVILVDDACNGVILNAIAIETAGSPTSAIGLTVKNSFGVALNSSYFNGMTVGVYLDGAARLSIRDSNFSNCTSPVSATGSTPSQQIYWEQATSAQVAASAPNIASNVSVDVWYIDNTKNKIDQTTAFNVSVSYTDLAAAGTKTIIDSTFLGEQWRILNVIILGLTQFTGGNRLLSVTDGVHTYTVLTAATLATSNIQAEFGSAAVPYSATPSDMVQPTTAGANLYAVYSGGATDYTAGIINLTIVAERVA
jgi:hypothetical protein